MCAPRAIGWTPEHTATEQARRTAAATIPCPTCWEQRSIWRQARNGEGLIPTPCTTCHATGRVPARRVR